MDKEDILKRYKLESATYSGSYGSFGECLLLRVSVCMSSQESITPAALWVVNRSGS